MSFKLKEQHLYGSSMLGIDVDSVEMIGAIPTSTVSLSHTIGLKQYSGSNHLGNVLSVFTDRKFPVQNGSTGLIDHYLPEVISSGMYAPFGGNLAELTFKKGLYPNSFNGKRDDKELGDWQEQNERFYMKHKRRFNQPDPITNEYPALTPYQFASNRPIDGIDLEGLEWFTPFLTTSRVTPIIEIVKPAVEVGTKTSELVGKVSETAQKTTEVSKTAPKFEEHHLIPKQSKQEPVVQEATKQGFKFEGKENLEKVQKFSKETGEGQHGNHPKYNTEIQRRITQFEKANPNRTPQESYDFIKNLTDQLKNDIKQNPGTKINDLYRPTSVAPSVQDNTYVSPAAKPFLNISRPVQQEEKQQKQEDPCKGNPNCI